LSEEGDKKERKIITQAAVTPKDSLTILETWGKGRIQTGERKRGGTRESQ